ncbi:MAG: hypothetical protein SFY92_02095 [Verrucomicrobiae bacterium]|nr:hypothetical protein [Verrucomicrobiae bacterium]
MRTTLDIPETLYKQAKIRAVEEGSTLRELLLRGLKHELEASPVSVAEPKPSYWANRKLRPAFKKAWESGALSGGTDSTQIISEGRDGR